MDFLNLIIFDYIKNSQVELLKEHLKEYEVNRNISYPGSDGSIKQIKKGDTPISYAARINNGAILEALIAEGFEIDNPNFVSGTALFWAVHNGEERAVDLLLKNGADPLWQPSEASTKMTLLEVAATKASASMIQSFLDSQATDTRSINRAVCLLVGHGNNIFSKNQPLITMLVDDPRCTSYKDETDQSNLYGYGQTILHKMCSSSFTCTEKDAPQILEIINKLREKGFDLHEQDNNKLTPLGFFYRNIGNGNQVVAAVLKYLGVQLQTGEDTAASKQHSPLTIKNFNLLCGRVKISLDQVQTSTPSPVLIS